MVILISRYYQLVIIVLVNVFFIFTTIQRYLNLIVSIYYIILKHVHLIPLYPCDRSNQDFSLDNRITNEKACILMIDIN